MLLKIDYGLLILTVLQYFVMTNTLLQSIETLPYEVLVRILIRMRGRSIQILSLQSPRIATITSQEHFQSRWLHSSPIPPSINPSNIHNLLQFHCVRIAKMGEWMPSMAIQMYDRLTPVCRVEAIRFFLDKGLHQLALTLAMHQREKDNSGKLIYYGMNNQKGLYYSCLKWRLRDYSIPTSPS